MHEIFYILARELREKKINALLIGGHAMQYYGNQRLTADTDWLICEEDLTAAGQILNANGYRRVDAGSGFARYSHPVSPLIDFDLMLVDRKSFEAMWRRSTEHPERNISWRLLHPEDMIALKLHAIKNNPEREAVDLADIFRIARFAGDELTPEKLEKLCRSYANERIFERLKELLKWKN